MLPYIFGLAACCFVLERLVPGWRLPVVRTWPYRVVLVNAFQFGVVLLAGFSWERWLSAWLVIQMLAWMSPAAGGCLPYFIGTFVCYCPRRWLHHNVLLWFRFPLIHHSPQRIE